MKTLSSYTSFVVKFKSKISITSLGKVQSNMQTFSIAAAKLITWRASIFSEATAISPKKYVPNFRAQLINVNWVVFIKSTYLANKRVSIVSFRLHGNWENVTRRYILNFANSSLSKAAKFN